MLWSKCNQLTQLVNGNTLLKKKGQSRLYFESTEFASKKHHVQIPTIIFEISKQKKSSFGSLYSFFCQGTCNFRVGEIKQ